MRHKQKGIECSINGCDNWCVGNDLCSKHNMQQYRCTVKGKAYVKKYNQRYKRPDVKKACELCKDAFTTARVSQVLCSNCSSGYEAQKRHRAKHPERYRARDIVSKRIKRGTLKREPCEVCSEDAESHHPDYNKPLDIVWLCKEHHSLLHSFV